MSDEKWANIVLGLRFCRTAYRSVKYNRGEEFIGVAWRQYWRRHILYTYIPPADIPGIPVSRYHVSPNDIIVK